MEKSYGKIETYSLKQPRRRKGDKGNTKKSEAVTRKSQNCSWNQGHPKWLRNWLWAELTCRSQADMGQGRGAGGKAMAKVWKIRWINTAEKVSTHGKTPQKLV